MALVLCGLTYAQVMAYLDECILLGCDVNDHLENIRAVLSRFREFCVKAMPPKCVFFQTEATFLGRIVSRDGVKIDPEKEAAVKEWPVPSNAREVHSFLGFMNYHREHVKDYVAKLAILYNLIKPNHPFTWTSEHQHALDTLKNSVINAPVLAYPDQNFILDTDASDLQIGTELSQCQNGALRIICHGSFTLTPAQRRYCTTRKQLLAIVRFTREYRHYLLGKRFLLRTDHSSLTWLTRFKNPVGQVARRLEELGQFGIQIVHRPSTQHGGPDGLSR